MCKHHLKGDPESPLESGGMCSDILFKNKEARLPLSFHPTLTRIYILDIISAGQAGILRPLNYHYPSMPGTMQGTHPLKYALNRDQCKYILEGCVLISVD